MKKQLFIVMYGECEDSLISEICKCAGEVDELLELISEDEHCAITRVFKAEEMKIFKTIDLYGQGELE